VRENVVVKEKSRALGRGLDALLAPGPSATGGFDKGLFVCALERIRPQTGQPRQHFDEGALDELAASLRAHGLLEPLVVRRASGGTETYEIIAGERRWRAAQRAGLTEVPVIVKDVSPVEAFELALIENIQREDLNPIEYAEALDRLMREHGHTHDALAGIIKKDRSTISNALRLLKLPLRVRGYVIEGRLSEGHARALLGLSDEKQIEELAARAVREGLTVRQIEALVRQTKPAATPEKAAPPRASAAVRDVETRLARRLGTKVALRDKKGKGQIVIAYNDLDELDRLLGVVGA
jgi:ParB family chromosome partitioning protein